MKSCGGWTRLSSGPGQGTSDLEVMSSSPDSAEFHTKLVFLTCFRTCGVNEPEELRMAEFETFYLPGKHKRSDYNTSLSIELSFLVSRRLCFHDVCMYGCFR